MYDRRHRPRLCRPLRIELNGTATYVQDVSSTGLSATFPLNARVGELIEGLVWLGRSALHFSGEVRWFRPAYHRAGEPARLGVRFVRADHALVQALEQAAAKAG